MVQDGFFLTVSIALTLATGLGGFRLIPLIFASLGQAPYSMRKRITKAWKTQFHPAHRPHH